jgi:hypothetical protein
MEQINKIAGYVIESLVHIWPYLLITIPMAVAVKLSGAAKFIHRIFNKNPLLSILLATIVGAFSPFCSCGVIPVITSLLIGGVPLAPVMSFWIASPSMDPEIFLLSTASIGWELSVWRLAATFIISLSSGYIIHFMMHKGMLNENVLRNNKAVKHENIWRVIWERTAAGIMKGYAILKGPKQTMVQLSVINNAMNKQTKENCCVSIENISTEPNTVKSNAEPSCNSCESPAPIPVSLGKKLLNETWKASSMVVKFMALAFFINAIIVFYVPEDFMNKILGINGTVSVVITALIGIPAYTSNITALPLINGLLSLGMNPGAALSFLIAGPTTTLPAMIAVWWIAKRKVFLLYLAFSLIGALLFGFLYLLFN